MGVSALRAVALLVGCQLAAGPHSRAQAADAVAQIRGVAPEDQERYRAATVSDGFRCFGDAHASAGSGQPPGPVLPHAVVNDNFCDCEDGSDEPGTSACAGQQMTMFYCANVGSVPAYVYSSRVNDGVCDCCDGSDEWQLATPCANTCGEEGRELSRVRARKEADLQSGLKQRRSLIEAGRKGLETAKSDLSALQAQLPELERREREAEDAWKAANEGARLEEKGEKATEATSSTTTVASTAAPAAADAQAQGGQGASEATAENSEDAAASATAAGAGGAKPVSEYAKWMEGAEEKPAEAEASSQTETTSKVVSEYTKWMDGADAVLEDSTTTRAFEPDALDDEDWGDDDTRDAPPPEDDVPLLEDDEAESESWPKRTWARIRKFFRNAWQEAFGPRKSPAERAVDSALEELRGAQKALKDSRQRIEELRKKSGQEADEATLAFADLTDRCIEQKFEEYNYKVCFFKDAKQDHTSVGKWKRWEPNSVALFDGGQYCPGGPARSLRVRFQCGAKLEILEMNEPSRCTYEAATSHPGACTEALLEAVQRQGPRRPTDEL